MIGSIVPITISHKWQIVKLGILSLPRAKCPHLHFVRCIVLLINWRGCQWSLWPHINNYLWLLSLQYSYKRGKCTFSFGHPKAWKLSASGGLRPLPLDTAGGSAARPPYRLTLHVLVIPCGPLNFVAVVTLLALCSGASTALDVTVTVCHHFRLSYIAVSCLLHASVHACQVFLYTNLSISGCRPWLVCPLHSNILL